ncbi:MAG: PqqD family protein [Denitratisoma sp.]|nr:PqqD family protein [Denitratisoma sp.]
MNTAKQDHALACLPSPDVWARLALSDSGFVFDPVTGNSYSVNGSGLAILKHLRRERDLARIVDSLQEEFDADPHAIERDVIEFANLLRNTFK